MTMKRLLLLLLLGCSACWGQGQNGVKPALGTQINWSHPLARGLVGCWLLNEGGGDWVNDLSGNGNTGTITGATWTGGQFGRCLSFDGDDYVKIPPNILFGCTGIALIAWFNTAANGGILSGYSAAGQYAWKLDLAAGKVRFEIRTSDDNPILSGATTVTNSQWHMAAGVYNGTTIAVYVDGRLDATPVAASGAILATYAAGAGFIGLDGYGIPPATHDSGYFTGKIDIPACYKCAPTPSEIAQLYKEPFGMLVQDRPDLYVTAAAPPAGRSQVIIIAKAASPVVIPIGVIGSLAWCLGRARRKAA